MRPVGGPHRHDPSQSMHVKRRLLEIGGMELGQRLEGAVKLSGDLEHRLFRGCQSVLHGASLPKLSGTVGIMSYAFTSIDELGNGPGFRKVRRALGVTAFGVNGIVFAPGFEGFLHYHQRQDELYFVHSGRARFEVGADVRELGPGGLCHVESTTPRRVSNASPDEELVLLVVGGANGYVERDGHMVDPEDIERRRAFSS
jgi:mannose-6-phosphate isomerase-like protein (cupin superfamily)